MSASEETCGQSWISATRKMEKEATDVGIISRMPLAPGDAAHPNASTAEIISGPDACLMKNRRGGAVGDLFTATHEQQYALVDSDGTKIIGFGVFSEQIDDIAQEHLIAAVQSSDLCTSKAPMANEEEVVFSVLKDPPSLRLELFVRDRQGKRVKSTIPQKTASNVMTEAINKARIRHKSTKRDGVEEFIETNA